jgi:putative oxidoreductase
VRKLVDLYARVAATLRRLDWIPILVMRLSIGLVFFDSGRHKLMKLGEMAEYFASLGIPLPGFNAVLASATECFGGLFLMLGLGTRIWGVMLAFLMLVAIKTAAIKEQNADTLLKFLYLHEWSFLLIFVWLAFTGGGKASLDELVARRFGLATGRRSPEAPGRQRPPRVRASG